MTSAEVSSKKLVVQLTDDQKMVSGTSLWADAFKRLRRNRMAIAGAAFIAFLVFIAVFAPTLAPKGFDEATLTDNNAAPSWIVVIFPTMITKSAGGYVTISEQYALGADKFGRDLLSRLLFGARISLAVAFIGPFISTLVGLLVGLTAGYMGGKVDNLLMRAVDVMYAFPTMLLIILLMAFFRTSTTQPESGTFVYTLNQLDNAMGGLLFIFIGIGLTAWMGMARLVRGQVLSVREKEYIEAARSIGAKPVTIMFQHILPNIIGPLIVSETLAIPGYISYEAFLSFIGLGVKPPTPSWGSMIAEGALSVQTYPNQVVFPALVLLMTMFAFNFLGDGLRDALDPRLHGVE
jgi:oligopeptide transport system permease protein